MHEQAGEPGGGERRCAQEAYDGPDRRIPSRRVPDGASLAPPDFTSLSDIDLYRAHLRAGHKVGDADADALAAEIGRRRLQP